MPTVRSFCRVCTSVCGILVDVEGDNVIRVRGDREHPLSKGYTCPKGRALPQMHHHPDRIEHPQMRVDGILQNTSWEACLDDLGTKLKDIVDRHGPDSVGIFFGTGVGMDAVGTRVAEALHAAIGTSAKFSPLTIDGTAKPLISDLVGGFLGMSGRPDYDNVAFMIFVGTNPVISHGHAISVPNPTGTVRAIAGRGQVWVIDPRRTETARLATGHIAPRPGTDHAVLAFLVREILRDGADPDVLVQDADVLAAAVEPFTLEHTAALADVAAADLVRLCEAVRAAPGPVAIETGTGVTMTADAANVTQWLAWALMILTGSMNRPGGIWFHPGFAYQLEAFELPISPPDGSLDPVRAAALEHSRSWANGLAQHCPTRSKQAISAQCSISAAACSRRSRTPGCWSRRCASSRCWPPRRSSRTTPRPCPRTCCRPRTSWNDPTSRSGTR